MKVLLLIKIWTMSFSSFYLPTDRDAVVSIETPDKFHCRAEYVKKQTLFKLKCEKDLKLKLYFEDKTPEINNAILIDGLMVKTSY